MPKSFAAFATAVLLSGSLCMQPSFCAAQGKDAVVMEGPDAVKSRSFGSPTWRCACAQSKQGLNATISPECWRIERAMSHSRSFC
jgi:hypothetical protein